MRTLSRPSAWLLLTIIAAGIVLLPQRGAAKDDHYRWYEPPTQIGDPDEGGGGRSELSKQRLPSVLVVSLLDGRLIVIKMPRFAASNRRIPGDRQRP